LKRNVDRYFEENKPHAGLARTSLRGGAVFVVARGMNIVVQLASTIVLARLLSPSDFGLVTMVLALVGFAPTLIDLGTTDASTQKTRISPVEISTLFWINVAIGGVLVGLLAGGSSLIASFFGEPTLTGIALVSSLTFVFMAASNQHFALMRRAMEFQNIALIDITANVLSSIIAVAMAFAGWGYWALVAKPILTSGFAAVGVWMSCPWVPGRPRFTPEVKELVGFGVGVTGFTMTDYLTKSADRVAVGFFYGATPLGYFQNAFLLYSNLLVILTESLHNIAVSGLSRLKDNVDELKRSWSAALSLVSFVSTPIFAMLAVTGQDFVVLLLGPKWAPAGPLLCILAVRGIAHSIERTLGWLHVPAGRSDRWMRWGFFSAACQLAALAAGLPFGLIGVVTAHTIAMFGLCVPALVYAGRPFGIGVKDVLSAVAPQIVAGLVAVALGLAIQQMFLLDFSQLARFLVSATICLATYLAIVVGIFKVKRPLELALSLLRDLVPMRLRGGS
jgi:polysaccharide transporter, PST family